MAKKKLSEKIGDAIDHVLHPDEAEAKAEAEKLAEQASKEKAADQESKFSLDEEIGKGLSPAQESSSIESDIQLHPKFAKFKKEGSNL